MRKTLTLALAAGLAHACPPRISAHELFRVAHEAQMRGELAQAARSAELAARTAREYSAAQCVLSQRPPRLRRLVIELKTTRFKK